jgi:hypothetical protein
VFHTRRRFSIERFLLAGFAAIVFSLSLEASGAAQPVPTIAVVVIARDAATRAGIPHVHVQLESDTRSYDGFTDRSGAVTFSAIVPDGYVVQLRQSDYDFGKATLISMAHDRGAFTFDGKRTRLRQIGAVSARTQPAASSARQSDDSPAAELSGSVLGNPYALPGLNVGPTGALQIGAQGPSATTVTIDGAPVFPSGVPVPAGLFGGDLFSAAATTSGVPGAPGGALALSPFPPTLDWQGLYELRPSSYAGEQVLAQERGTTGNIGISMTHADSTSATPLNGTTFRDTSGLDYPHDTATVRSGDLVALRAPLGGDTVLTFNAGDTSLTTPIACTLIEGSTPCGFGPGATSQTTFTFATLSAEETFERSTLKGSVFASATTLATDEASARFLGLPIGFDDREEIAHLGASLSGTVLVGKSRIATFGVTATRDSSALTDPVTFDTLPIPLPANADVEAKLELPLVQGRRTSASVLGGFDNRNGTGKVWIGSTATYTIDAEQHLDLDLASGQLGSPTFGFPGVDSSVSAVQFDCAGHALTGGPIVPSGPSSNAHGRIGYTYARGHLSAQVGTQANVVRKYPVQNAIVPAAGLAPALFPANFFASVSAAAGTICGTPQPIAQPALDLLAGGEAATMVELRTTASLTIPLGVRGTFSANDTVDDARAFGLPPLFAGAINVRDGSQLPSVPAHQASATLAYAFSHATTLLADVNDFGATTVYSRHAFATADLGLRFTLPRGELVAAVQNLGNTAAPAFERFAPFPLLPQPYAPRTYSVAFRLPLGNSYVDRSALLNPPATSGNTVFFMPIEFEGAQHVDYFALNTTNTSCGPENRTRAKEILAALQTYVSHVEADRAAARTPQPATIDGVTFTPLPARIGYTIRLTLPSGLRNIAPILRCGRIHLGDVPTAQKLGIYYPDARTRYEDGFFTLYFAPQAGLYFPPQATDESSASLDRAPAPRFPTRIPIERAAIDEAACPSSYRGVVADLLADLRVVIPSYYGGPPAPARAYDFTIGAHPAKGGRWLEIAFRDFQLARAFAGCVGVPTATDQDLRDADLGGTNSFLSIDYAPAVGFYRKPL